MSDIPLDEPAAALLRPRLSSVTERLDQARRRALALGLAEAGVMALGAGLATWCLLRLGVAIRWTEVSADTLFLASVVVAVTALALAAIAALAEGPTRAMLARRADAAFALDERISTAVEIIDGPFTPLAKALLADVERRAEAIRPGAILHRRTRFLAVPLLGLAFFAGALILAPLPPAVSSERAAAATPSVFLGVEETAVLAAELRAIAVAVAAEAAGRNDAFLAAIAAATDEMVERLEAGDPVDRAAIGNDLARLGAYADTAYQRAGAPADRAAALSRLAAATVTGTSPQAGSAMAWTGSGPAPSLADPGRADDARESPAAAVPAAEPAAPRSGDPTGPAAPESGPAGTVTRPTPGAEIVGEAVQEPCNFDAGAECAMAAGDNPFGLERGNVNLPPDPAGAGPPNAPEGPAMAEGQLVGPAADAGAGEAVFAGRGTRPLGDGPADDPATVPGGAAMLLPDRGTGTGDRIRLDMPPQPGGAILLEGMIPPGVAWRVLPEAVVARPLLPPGDREIAGRYFDRPPGDE